MWASARVWLPSCVGVAVLQALSIGQAAANDAGSPRVLTRIDQVRSLSRDEARRHLPVRVTATVTYFDPVGRNLFVQDQTGGIWVGWQDKMPQVRAGDVLALGAVTVFDSFAPRPDRAALDCNRPHTAGPAGTCDRGRNELRRTGWALGRTGRNCARGSGRSIPSPGGQRAENHTGERRCADRNADPLAGDGQATRLGGCARSGQRSVRGHL